MCVHILYELCTCRCFFYPKIQHNTYTFTNSRLQAHKSYFTSSILKNWHTHIFAPIVVVCLVQNICVHLYQTMWSCGQNVKNVQISMWTCAIRKCSMLYLWREKNLHVYNSYSMWPHIHDHCAQLQIPLLQVLKPFAPMIPSCNTGIFTTVLAEADWYRCLRPTIISVVSWNPVDYFFFFFSFF